MSTIVKEYGTYMSWGHNWDDPLLWQVVDFEILLKDNKVPIMSFSIWATKNCQKRWSVEWKRFADDHPRYAKRLYLHCHFEDQQEALMFKLSTSC